MARDLLAYLDDTTENPTNAQGRDLFEYLGNQEQPTNIPGVAPVSANLFQYDASKYDYGGISPHELPNLEDIRARNQGVLDALGRSTVNLVGKTGINVIGGTLGTIYGTSSAIANGEISKLWDNSLTTVLDAASEAIGDTFKVYKSADYEERSLLGRLFTHPIQFTDEFMDTLSFTTGAVVTELLTAGLASATIAPRALKYLKGLDRGAEAMDAANAMRTAGVVSKLGTAGTLTRQLATGAAWEASVEARHGAIDLKESLYNDALAEFGVQDISQLPDEVVDDIEERASNAGLFTFLTNMALVGGSNIVQFPKIFGAGFNTSKRATNRIAQEAGEYIDTALPRTRGDRFIRNVATAARNPFMEGVVEEGGQSVLSQTAAMYWDRKNDDEAKSEVDRFLHSFGTALKDTYTTGEGWYEIGMGMLIGSLGAPGRGLMPGQRGIDPETGERYELWTGGIAGSFQERAREDAEVAQMVNKLNQSPELMKAMQANYDFLTTAASIQPAQDRALDRDDTFMFENYRDDMLHAWIDSRMQAGLSSDLDTQVEDLKKIDTEDFYVSFRGEEQADKTSTQDKVLFKQRMIQNLESQIDNTREAYNIVDNNYQGTNEDLRQELIYNIASAKNLDIREQNINRAVSDLTSGTINDLFLRRSDERITLKSYLNQLEDRINSEDTSEEEKSAIQQTINSLRNLDDNNLRLSLDEYSQLETFIQTRPVEASLNLGAVTKLMADSRKLRQRRQAFIDIYNTLFTEEGQRQFEEYQQQLRADEAKRIEEQRKNEQTREENKTVKKRQQEIKKKAKQAKEADTVQETDPVTEETESSLEATEEPVVVEGTQVPPDTAAASLQERINRIQTRLDDPNTPSAAKIPLQRQLDRLVEELNSATINPSEEVVSEIGDVMPEEVESASEELETSPDQVIEEQSLLTPEEQAVVDILDQEDITNQTKEENTDGYVKNDIRADSKSNKIVDLTRKREVGNTIISLNINYRQVVDEEQGTSSLIDVTDDQGNLQINENFDSRLQDPQQFGKGTEVTMVVPTYNQMMEAGMRSDYTIEEYNQDRSNSEKLPIAFLDDTGKIIGYLPTTNNVRERVQESFKDAEIVKNQKLRNFVASNPDKSFRTTITRKSTGTPMFVKTNGNLYDRLGNGERFSEGVELAIFKNGKLMNNLSSTVSTGIALPVGMTPDEYFQEGVVYTVVPTADGTNSFALPTNINNIGTQLADTIVRMIQLFRANPQFSRDAALINERNNLSSEIDFTNYQQFKSAVESIIYTNSTDNIFDVDTKNNKIRLGITKDKVFDLNDFMKDEKVRNKVAYELAGRYPAIRLSNFGQRFNTFELVDNQLQNRRYRNYFDYLNDTGLVQTRLQGQPIENTDRLYFTAQSIIEFSDPIVTETIERENTDIVEDIRPQTQDGRPISRLGARPKSKRKTKPDIENDFDLLNNIDENLDQQVEELMRICKSK